MTSIHLVNHCFDWTLNQNANLPHEVPALYQFNHHVWSGIKIGGIMYGVNSLCLIRMEKKTQQGCGGSRGFIIENMSNLGARSVLIAMDAARCHHRHILELNPRQRLCHWRSASFRRLT